MKKTKFALLLAFVPIILCLTSCDSKQHVVDFDNMLDESGHYIYNGIAWGSDKETVEESLGFKIENLHPFFGSHNRDGDVIDTYLEEKSAKIVVNGKTYTGSSQIAFSNGGLKSVYFYLRVSKSEHKPYSTRSSSSLRRGTAAESRNRRTARRGLVTTPRGRGDTKTIRS